MGTEVQGGSPRTEQGSLRWTIRNEKSAICQLTFMLGEDCMRVKEALLWKHTEAVNEVP